VPGKNKWPLQTGTVVVEPYNAVRKDYSFIVSHAKGGESGNGSYQSCSLCLFI